MEFLVQLGDGRSDAIRVFGMAGGGVVETTRRVDDDHARDHHSSTLRPRKPILLQCPGACARLALDLGLSRPAPNEVNCFGYSVFVMEDDDKKKTRFPRLKRPADGRDPRF